MQAASADVRLAWEHAVLGHEVGVAGLAVGDLAGDGVQRIVTTGSDWWSENSYFYVISRRAGGRYEQDWVSEDLGARIDSLVVANWDTDPALEIVVSAGATVRVFDGATRALESEVPLPWNTRARSLVVAELDANGRQEYVFCDETGGDLIILDAETGWEAYRSRGEKCTSVAVGNVDDDPGLEIVSSGQTSGRVRDAATRKLEWQTGSELGTDLRLGDVDRDGRDEIVARYYWYLVVWNAERQAQAGALPGASVFWLLDLEGDGQLEIVAGQYGSGLIVYDGASRAQRWSAQGPSDPHALAAGDPDADGVGELVFGAGAGVSIYNPVTRSEEWRSQELEGPFPALSHGDLDADGRPEILYSARDSGEGFWMFVRDAARQELQAELPAATWSGGRIARLRNANVDADPAEEILLATTDGSIVCLDGATHAEQWRARLPQSVSSLQTADVDADRTLELVAAVASSPGGSYVYVYDAASGTLEWRSPSFAFGSNEPSFLRIANIDGDPQPEIVVASAAGLYVMDRVARTTQAFGDYDATAMDAADLDGDGRSEIVLGTSLGQVIVVYPTRVVLQTMPGMVDGLALVDLDADGVYERFVASGEEIFLYDSTGAQMWRSGRLAPGIGGLDTLLVADVDRDGRLELLAGLGRRGIRLYEIVGPTRPSLSISDASVVEGNRGAIARFTVALSPAATLPVTVAFETAAGSAQAGTDFAPVQGTLTFEPAETTHVVDVPIVSDFAQEPSESFRVLLADPVRAAIADGEGQGTIVDDDLAGLAIDDVRLHEPESGSAMAVFTVSLAPPSTSTVSVDYFTEDGTASSPDDFVATSGTLTFAPGTRARTVEVPVNADDLREAPESFRVRLDNAGGSSIARGTGTAWIQHAGSSAFYTLPPCRVIDTRESSALRAGIARVFSIGGRCGIPMTARAVAATITVTRPSAAGYLTLVPADAAPSAVSNVNFRAGTTRAGHGIVPLSASGQLRALSGQAEGSVELIVDVTGYYE